MFKWGILGTAKINNKIIPFLLHKKKQKLFAVASRNLEKAQKYAHEFNIERFYGSYDELLTAPDINAVYISLPNEQHFQWAKNALLNGKHVLCEKPLVLTSKDATELLQISQTSGCLLMEGFMYRHHQQTTQLLNLISSGQIGKLQHIRTSFHFTIPEGPNIRLNPENGGGVIWDLGCYIVNLSNFLFGTKPQSVSAFAKFAKGIDVSCAGLMNYSEGKTATFDCSFEGLRRNFLEIVGTQGVIICENPFKGGFTETVKIFTESKTIELNVRDEINPYERQFDHFLESIESKKSPQVTIQDSIDTIKTIEALLQSATSKQTVNPE